MLVEIRHVRLAYEDPILANEDYSVFCKNDKVVDVHPSGKHMHSTKESDIELHFIIDGQGGILIPSFCHSHIHLDKCYLLDKGAPLVTGDFAEALQVTSDVKATFKSQPEDVYERGDRLVRESLMAGVTSMRAHVEVDKTVDDVCLSVGIKLKEKYAESCDIQLALFMQDPIFDNPEDASPGLNATINIVENALKKHHESLSAIGSAPYVERTRAQQLANIQYVLNHALAHNLHLDFHLDYDLSPLPADPTSPSAPLIYHLLDELHKLDWTTRMPNRTIAIGHATRLTLFSPAQLTDLRARIGALPVYFIGLPQSDMYMMGRGSSVRGTLDVCRLGREYGLNVAMAVNNVVNAFTPQGSPDPLSLVPFGVAVYQDATADGLRRLLEAISTVSKASLGEPATPLVPAKNHQADFVLFPHLQSLQAVALCPTIDRKVIRHGAVIVETRTNSSITTCMPAT